MAKVDVTITQGGETVTLADGFTYIDPVAWDTASTETSDLGSASVTVDVPAGTVDGDLLILTLHVRGISGTTTPTGFTLAESVTAAASVYTYWRIASSEPASYTLDVPNWSFASMGRVTGHDAADPIGATSTVSEDTVDTIDVPSITVTGDSLLVSAITTEGSSSSEDFSVVGDMTALFSFAGFAAGSIGVQNVGDGATGIRTWNWTPTDDVGAIMIEINKA